MAQQRKKTTRTRTTASGRARSASDQALKRLQDSVDAAEVAAKELRKEMSRGSRELLTDVERTLRDARKNLRRVSGRVTKDLDEVRKAATGKRTTQRRGSQRRSSTQRSTGQKRSTGQRRSTGQKRSTGQARASRSKRAAKK